MITYQALDDLRRLAEKAHSDQYRRDGVTPYIEHIYAVERRVMHLGNDYRAVAIGHDLLEDTTVTVSDLNNAGVPSNIILAVALLTKPNNGKVSYDDYLVEVKKNELARQVKIADMLSNLADSPTNKQIRKYAKGLLFLVDGE